MLSIKVKQDQVCTYITFNYFCFINSAWGTTRQLDDQSKRCVYQFRQDIQEESIIEAYGSGLLHFISVLISQITPSIFAFKFQK